MCYLLHIIVIIFVSTSTNDASTHAPTNDPTNFPTPEPSTRATLTRHIHTEPTPYPTSGPTYTELPMCNIGKTCKMTEDCCDGTTDERINGITCSHFVKWNDPLETSNKFCCMKNMKKCMNHKDCCGGKTKCLHGKCHNVGQWRPMNNAVINEQKTENSLFSIFDDHMEGNSYLFTIVSWTMIGICVLWIITICASGLIWINESHRVNGVSKSDNND
eukprot:UN02557